MESPARYRTGDCETRPSGLGEFRETGDWSSGGRGAHRRFESLPLCQRENIMLTKVKDFVIVCIGWILNIAFAVTALGLFAKAILVAGN